MSKERTDSVGELSGKDSLVMGDIFQSLHMERPGGAKSKTERYTILELPASSIAAEISVPNNWLRRQEGEHSATPQLTLRPSLSDSTLISVSRHRDLPESAASETFKTLLARGLNNNESQTVFNEGTKAGEFERKVVSALTAVLGTNLVGDNQLSNLYKHPDPRAPIFHLEKMELKNLNGKIVLAVDGHYVQTNGDGSLKTDLAGKPMQSSYTGIFAAQDSRAQGIEEIYMLSGDQDNFQKNKPVFNRILKSINWHHGL